MRTKARMLGHPIHPMLVPIPIGLFLASLVFDLIVLGRVASRAPWVRPRSG
jgi:uncharacterized membrane protein